MRNIISTALVFAISPWMDGMGVYNMFVLLSVIAAAVALTCIPIIIWGRSFRIRYAEKYRALAALQY